MLQSHTENAIDFNSCFWWLFLSCICSSIQLASSCIVTYKSLAPRKGGPSLTDICNLFICISCISLICISPVYNTVHQQLITLLRQAGVDHNWLIEAQQQSCFWCLFSFSSKSLALSNCHQVATYNHWQLITLLCQAGEVHHWLIEAQLWNGELHLLESPGEIQI